MARKKVQNKRIRKLRKRTVPSFAKNQSAKGENQSNDRIPHTESDGHRFRPQAIPRCLPEKIWLQRSRNTGVECQKNSSEERRREDLFQLARNLICSKICREEKGTTMVT